MFMSFNLVWNLLVRILCLNGFFFSLFLQEYVFGNANLDLSTLDSGNRIYSHEWAVEVDGGDDVAKEIANKNNFIYIGKVFDNVHMFKHRRLAKRSLEPSTDCHNKLLQENKVVWAEQQVIKKRVKRSVYSRHHIKSTYLNDPKWPDMWYLNRGDSLDMNVQKAWAEGITGKGVVVTILDDGIEKDHPDLIRNYDPNASYDVNGQDADPGPRYDLLDSNRHGTRCAGEVAAGANNSLCSVGVAYEASVGGVRMLDGEVTDAVEARSLALNPQHIDIYSASWGPDDDGKTVDGPGKLATRAFIEGIAHGRNGKGSIFVWASGNGGKVEDNCNCDGYTNSIWTLSISSSTENGRVPWYSEACSSTLATTYSSGSVQERQIVTTDIHHMCTESHTGTSASAPLAAGIVALALQANLNLTWRDMQHVVVRTSRPENLHAPDWLTNGVGRKVSHRLIPQQSFVTLELEVVECPGVNYLEHVQSKVTLSADRRGEIEIYLISPAGTKSTLLAQRPQDHSKSGFIMWPFMTVHMWGERPFGKWSLEVHNNNFYSTGITLLHNWTLVMHGTRTNPDKRQARGVRKEKGKTVKQSTSEWTHNLTPFFGNFSFPNTVYNPNVWSSISNSPGLYVPSSTSPNTAQYPYHRDSHSGKASIKEWTLLLHGTESEPGKEPDSENSFENFGNSVGSPSETDIYSTSHRQKGSTETREKPSSTSPKFDEANVASSPKSVLHKFCTTFNSSGSCIACEVNASLYNGLCVVKCPGGWYSWVSDASNHSLCIPCHYSCHRCSGPMNYQCLECWGDATLSYSQGQNFCYNSSLFESYQRQRGWFVALFLVILAVFFIVAIAIVILFCCSKQNSKSLQQNVVFKKSGYTKIDLTDHKITEIPFRDNLSSEEDSEDVGNGRI